MTLRTGSFPAAVPKAHQIPHWWLPRAMPESCFALLVGRGVHPVRKEGRISALRCPRMRGIECGSEGGVQGHPCRLWSERKDLT